MSYDWTVYVFSKSIPNGQKMLNIGDAFMFINDQVHSEYYYIYSMDLNVWYCKSPQTTATRELLIEVPVEYQFIADLLK